MTRKTIRNIIWIASGALAVAALMYNPFHLYTAGLMFIWGAIQTDERNEEDELRGL